MVKKFSEENIMRKSNRIRLIHEGGYVAEIDVELIYTDEGWSPYLSIDEAQKLDDVREALRKGDLKEAAQYGRIYSLIPIAV